MPVVPSFQLFYDKAPIAEIPMNRSPFVIGRKAGCSLRLIEGSVSREHLRVILHADGSLAAEDLSSTNGTYLNGQRIVRRVLHPNDRLVVGRLSLVFHHLKPEELTVSPKGFLSRVLKKKEAVPFCAAKGEYVLPLVDTMTEFDAVSYAMVADRAVVDEKKLPASSYVRVVPRLQMLAQQGGRKEEITKFSVSQTVFDGIEGPTMSLRPAPLPVLPEGGSTRKRLRIPWKTIELVLIPVILVVVGVLMGRYFVKIRIQAEWERAEKHWTARLAQVASQYQYAEDSAFSEPAPYAAAGPRRAVPLSVDEVWRRIDARPALRNFLLFEILDEVLASEDFKWSLADALRNLARLSSVTSRLPSVKKFQLVLNMEAPPFKMEGLSDSHVLFLSESGSAPPAQSYAEYRADMTARLGSVSSCAGVRRAASPGKVVMAFTVNASGRIGSIFINKARSSQESRLWSCVEEKLKTVQLDSPPGGPLSIVYTFAFAGPQKVGF
ncbi:MAG: FHA domain-containing protein [Pseudomonadota bacterium]